ncbi:MAG: hypothetical protein V4671_18595 [Armatimonadota bacterium]
MQRLIPGRPAASTTIPATPDRRTPQPIFDLSTLLGRSQADAAKALGTTGYYDTRFAPDTNLDIPEGGVERRYGLIDGLLIFLEFDPRDRARRVIMSYGDKSSRDFHHTLDDWRKMLPRLGLPEAARQPPDLVTDRGRLWNTAPGFRRILLTDTQGKGRVTAIDIVTEP